MPESQEVVTFDEIYEEREKKTEKKKIIIIILVGEEGLRKFIDTRLNYK